MNERNLIRLGKSSYAISLPIDWIKKAGLDKGDKVSLIENSNGEMIISTEFVNPGKSKKKTEINVKEKYGEEIARDIISAYINGNKIIKVQGGKKGLRMAQSIAKKFLNLEIVKKENGEAIFEDLIDVNNIDIKKFLKRMDNNIKEILFILKEVTEGREDIRYGLSEFEEIDKDINKCYFLIWRLMNQGINNPAMQTSMEITPKDFVNTFWIAYNIEHIGDEVKNLPKKPRLYKNEILKEILDLIISNHEESIKAFLKKEKSLAKNVIMKKKKVMSLCNKLSDKEGFGAIAEMLRRIALNIHNNSKLIFYEF